MEEKGLWQNQNNWILGRVKQPGAITNKKNLMKERKKIVKTNQASQANHDEGQYAQEKQTSLIKS